MAAPSPFVFEHPSHNFDFASCGVQGAPRLSASIRDSWWQSFCWKWPAANENKVMKLLLEVVPPLMRQPSVMKLHLEAALSLMKRAGGEVSPGSGALVHETA